MRILIWAFRAFVFFTLFAFALNNQQDATVFWFFGAHWRAPMVILVLTAFAAGGAVGVLAMLPSWWRHWRLAQRHATPLPPLRTASDSSLRAPSEFGAEQPPREGL